MSNIYKVQADGKAPKGLAVGDQVVTGGGTYQISGVKADGSYDSQLVDKEQTTANYTGAYASAPSAPGAISDGANTPMVTPDGKTVNSVADTPATTPAAADWYAKARQQLGLDTEAAQAAIAGEDRTELIKEYYAKILEAELAGMDTAYKNAGTELELTKNKVAAQDAVARQAFDERAVATGLNTGVTGQAELARSSVLQGNLAQIDRDKSALLAEYESAIAKAKAENDAAMTEALYEELLRLKGLSGESSASSTASGGSSASETGSADTVNPTGTIVPVQPNGKAPAGCKVGDLVVTGGGTYIITKVNADGSYESKLYSKDVTTGNYNGAYSDGSLGAGATQTTPPVQAAPAAPANQQTPVTPVSPVTPTHSQNYDFALTQAKAMAANGADRNTIGSYLSSVNGLTSEEYSEILGSANAVAASFGENYSALLDEAKRMQRQGVTKGNIIEYLLAHSSDVTEDGARAILGALGFA